MKNNTRWLKNPLAVFADSDCGGGLVIENGKIKELVKSGGQPTCQIDIIDDVSELVILPGLINSHHHFYQTLTRANKNALNKELFHWLKSLYQLWAHLDIDMIESATKLALAELMLSGCTTASDHHYIFNEALQNAIDVEVEVAKKLGVRAVLTRGSMSLGVRDGGLPPQNIVQSEDEIIADSQRVIDAYHQNGVDAMTSIALAPCSPFSVSPDLMKQSALLAQEKNVRLHTHLAETLDEKDFCIKKFGLTMVDYLESVGWLNERVWLAHGIHFDETEIKRLGRAGVGVCHCPSSNMLLASGICQTLTLEKYGVTVGLGVDGSASNDASNLMQEVRAALYLGKLHYGASQVDHNKALTWATAGSAKLLGKTDIGKITVGAMADLAFFSLSDELRFSGSEDAIAALLLSGASRAARLMVGGDYRVYDYELLGVDLNQLIAEHSAQAKRLLAKF